MAKFKKYGIAALVIVAALLINFIICIFLHSYVMAVVEDPFTVEGLTQVFEDQKNSQVLDTYEEGDSALTLVKKEDGNVFLLEFHKNLLLPRYQVMDVVHVIPEAETEHLPVATVFRSYSVLVDHHETLALETTDSHNFQFTNFFLLYGLNTLLLVAVEFLVWKTGKNFKKAKASAKKK